jgi:transcriptional regulator of arginine metabolism
MNIYSGDVLRRREEILRIVGSSTVHSQDELMGVLKKRGFRVTQPTLSRDLRELGLAKTPRGYVAPGAFAAASPAAYTPVSYTPSDVREGRFEQLVRGSVLSADAAGNLLVIRTPPAAAQPVASAIDGMEDPDILGTIGGDDTIFVAFRTARAAAALARRIHQIAGLTPARRRPRA